MTPLALSLEELLPLNQQTYPNIIMLRSALVLSSLVVALSVPFFGKFALTLVFLLFIRPTKKSGLINCVEHLQDL
jgi:hypothetical protein